MRYEQIPAELFTENRKRLAKQMKPGSVAVFISNDLVPKSADATYEWRQNPDLFYLTGVDQEETYLIMFPDAPVKEWREMLFLRETNATIKTWEGEKLTMERARDVSGIEKMSWSQHFPAAVHSVMQHAETVYLNLNEHDRFSAHDVEYAELRFAKMMKAKYPLHRFERMNPIISSLRKQKSKTEIALLQKAIDITELGFRRMLGFVKPGVWEFEVEAELTHEYIRNRATGHAYTPIVATGENACILHYIQNNKQCKAGQLLLVDAAAEYANYNADLTRTIPVSGKFTPRQKAVYNAVLRVMREARSLMREGVTLVDWNREIEKIMEAELIKLKLLSKKDVAKQDPNRPLLKKYFPHGTGHFLGLDVHDVGNRYDKLKEGCVITCEPGIYIPREKLGVRIENNILVTKKGPVDLMEKIPVEVTEIEALMNARNH